MSFRKSFRKSFRNVIPQVSLVRIRVTGIGLTRIELSHGWSGRSRVNLSVHLNQ